MGIYSIQRKDQVLNEVYFGETPGIMRCFNAFSAWRSKYLMDRKVYMMNSAAERDPLLGKFVAEIEREFGLYSYSIVIINSDTINAFTFPAFFNFNSKLKGTERVEFGKDGYRFKKECKVSMITCIFGGLFFNSDYTNREVFAIMLHEIGHNFQDVISDRMHTIGQCANMNDLLLSVLQLAMGNMKTLLLPFLNDKTLGSISKLYNEMNIGQRNSIISTANTIFGTIKNSIDLASDLTMLFIPPIAVIYAMGRNLMSAISTLIWAPFSRRHAYYGEIMADRFASYYGFGKDLIFALDKFGDQRKGAGIRARFMEVPIYSHSQELILLPLKFLLDITDEHPATQARFKSVIDGLKTEMNRPGISPKLKKQLDNDIKRTEKTIDDIFEEGKDIDDPRVVENYMRSFMYYAGGGDLKYLVKNRIFDTEKDVQQTYIKNTKIK